MGQPTYKQVFVRAWELRPGSTGVLAMTAGTVLLAAVAGWPAWASAVVVLFIAAACAVLLAVLELSHDADSEPVEKETSAASAGGAFAVSGDVEDARRVTLKTKVDES